jgi:hypothetical protein
MVDRWKELSDVKCDNACSESFGASRMYKMGQVYSSILSGPLGDASKLVRMEDVVCDTIELKPVRKHLFD